MSKLKSQFKTNSSLVNDGVWFHVQTNNDAVVKDGKVVKPATECRVKLRRPGRGNALWSLAFREHTADKDMDNLSPEEDEVVTARIFAQSSVAEWEHFQVEDGVDVPFSVEAATNILQDPDWVELLKNWQGKANSLAPFQDKREEESGNL